MAEAIRENSGLFPSFEQLQGMGRSALASNGIGRFGGFPYWRRHLGFEGVYVLADGRTIVKSIGELVLGNVLLFHGVPFAYEKELFGTNLKCDFRIAGTNPEYDIYIEHFGNKGERQRRHFMGRDYLERWGKKLRLYRRAGCVEGQRLIITRDDEISGRIYKHQFEYLSQRLVGVLSRGNPGAVPAEVRNQCLQPHLGHVEAVIEDRLREFMKKLGRFPTSNWLQEHSPGLATAIGRHGGINAWRERFGVRVIKRGPGYWDSPERIEVALRKVMREHGGRFPTGKWLEEKRNFALLVAINRHGGMPYWRGRMGFPPIKKPMGYWKSDKNLRETLGKAIQEHGKGFPTQRWLQQNGFNSVAKAIQKRGHR